MQHSAAAAMLYRQAACHEAASAINNLAYLIEYKKITASRADFVAVGIGRLWKDYFIGRHIETAAILYQVAATCGCAIAIKNLAILIDLKCITASKADFEAVGVNTLPRNIDPHYIASLFHLKYILADNNPSFEGFDFEVLDHESVEDLFLLLNKKLTEKQRRQVLDTIERCSSNHTHYQIKLTLFRDRNPQVHKLAIHIKCGADNIPAKVAYSVPFRQVIPFLFAH